MAYFDLPLEELHAYAPLPTEGEDFDGFWASTLAATAAAARPPVLERLDAGVAAVRAYDLTFSGFAGDPIKGWLILPACAAGGAGGAGGAGAPATGDGALAGIVSFVGYSGGRAEVRDHVEYALAGYAVLVMDTRGQGWTPGSRGATGDPHGIPGPAVPGMMTRGITDPGAYYYRRVYADAVRAVATLRAHPAVDPARVGVVGGSQGGGIAIAASGLADGVAATVADVPFLCHFRRAVVLTDRDPYAEIRRYLQAYRDREELVFATLDLFDGVNLAARAHNPVLMSTALMDLTCPPSTVFAAYRRWAGPKEIAVYPYNDHEGGGAVQARRAQKFLARTLRP